MPEIEGSSSTSVATVADKDDIQTSDASADESSNATALTPEERDAATFARYGFEPDGITPLKKAEDPKVDDKPAATDPVTDPVKSEAGDDDEDEDADADEITDERITASVEAALELNPDLVRNNPKVRAILEAEIRQQLEEEVDAQQAAQTANQHREQLIGKGKEAVDKIAILMDSAQAELTKAKNGEDDVKWDVLAKATDNLAEYLGTFGQAAIVDTQRQYEGAFSKGFIAAQKLGGPMTEDEQVTIETIVNTANRIEADLKQGDARFDAAKRYFYEESMKFVAQRAYDAGQAKVVAKAKAKRDARKTILDSDAVLAGAAKEAARRVKLPPAPTEGGPVSTIVSPTLESYQAAKRAGNYDLADEIMRAMESQTPATTRR